MSVAALSTAGFSQYISETSDVAASQQAFQSLQQSLASGNLTSAQKAFNTYNQLSKNAASASSSSSSTASTGSQLSTDMAALGSAIGSGNLSTAQAAFATVQSDLKSSPPQAITNAESAVAQTVQWVDDLLSLSNSSNTSAAPFDPATALLNDAYGQSSTNSTTNPMVSLLESKYGTGNPSSADADTSTTPTAPDSGNASSGASVNAYA